MASVRDVKLQLNTKATTCVSDAKARWHVATCSQRVSSSEFSALMLMGKAGCGRLYQAVHHQAIVRLACQSPCTQPLGQLELALWIQKCMPSCCICWDTHPCQCQRAISSVLHCLLLALHSTQYAVCCAESTAANSMPLQGWYRIYYCTHGFQAMPVKTTKCIYTCTTASTARGVKRVDS